MYENMHPHEIDAIRQDALDDIVHLQAKVDANKIAADEVSPLLAELVDKRANSMIGSDDNHYATERYKDIRQNILELDKENATHTNKMRDITETLCNIANEDYRRGGWIRYSATSDGMLHTGRQLNSCEGITNAYPKYSRPIEPAISGYTIEDIITCKLFTDHICLDCFPDDTELIEAHNAQLDRKKQNANKSSSQVGTKRNGNGTPIFQPDGSPVTLSSRNGQPVTTVLSASRILVSNMVEILKNAHGINPYRTRNELTALYTDNTVLTRTIAKAKGITEDEQHNIATKRAQAKIKKMLANP